jgi:hypothetical protein
MDGGYDVPRTLWRKTRLCKQDGGCPDRRIALRCESLGAAHFHDGKVLVPHLPPCRESRAQYLLK